METLEQPMLLAKRNAQGEVRLTVANKTVAATIPRDRSMLGIVGVNGLINGGEYQNDGWVYFNGERCRKWHIKYQGVRVWEPHFNDLLYLYRLYKRTQQANQAQWQHIAKILHEIWESGPVKNNEVIAHAQPTHNFTWNKDTKPWWVFKVHRELDGYEGLSFGFDWLDNKPKKLVNHYLGQRLFDAERRWSSTTCARTYKARIIFYEAMKRSLPKPVMNQALVLQFGEDSFWFYVVNRGPQAVWWEQFGDQYQVEVKRVV
jgi:hypothetical protein